MQKQKALAHLPNPSQQLHQLGSVMVAPASDAAAVDREFALLKEMGCVVDKLTSAEVYRCSVDAPHLRRCCAWGMCEAV